MSNRLVAGLLFASLAAASSCGSAAPTPDDLLGSWKAPQTEGLWILREGSSYKVKVAGEVYVGTQQGNALKINSSTCPELVYSRPSESLFFCGKEFDRFNPAPARLQKTASGVAWKIVQAGRGKDNPKAGDLVNITYTIWSSLGLFELSSKTETVRRNAITPPSPVLSKASG